MPMAYLNSVDVRMRCVVEWFFDPLTVQHCRRFSVIYLQQRLGFSFVFVHSCWHFIMHFGGLASSH